MNCTKSPPSPNCLEEEIKQLQGKLKQTENKMNEWRNQSQTMKQELKLANKVICQEVGEGSNIHSLLAENSTWKGRAQQIIALQQKVCDLKQNLKQLQAKVSNNGEIPAPVENSNSQALKQIVNKRKDIQEKLDQELKNSQEKYASLKTKFDGIKARCQILSNEVKLNKQQIQVLLEKGKRDEDLIETLMNQLSRLKEMIASKPSVPRHEPIELHSNSLSNIVEKQNTENLVKQLKVIIEEKDKRLVLLENQVGQAQYKKCPQCNNYCESSIYDEDSEATNLSDDSLNQAILPITVDASS
ncbi:coiled-coil domain-containing protein 13-like, partial [Argonauta hians]